MKKYNLDDFLQLGNEEENNAQPNDEEAIRPARTEVIYDEDDDELERPPDPEADEDLDEDDYGKIFVSVRGLISLQARITLIMEKAIWTTL